MNTYNWTFPQLDTAPTEGDLTDVCKTIHWRFTAVSGTETNAEGVPLSVSAYGTASAGEADPDNFVAFDDLTPSSTAYIWGSTGGGTKNVDLRLLNTGTLEFRFRSSTGTKVASKDITGFSTGVYYHIVCVWTQNSDMILYINNVAEDTVTAYNETNNFDDDIFVGAVNNNGSPTAYLSCDIDEFAYWSARAISPSEVSELYNSGSGLQYPFSASGWTGKISGVTDPSKVNGLAVANIIKINGVE